MLLTVLRYLLAAGRMICRHPQELCRAAVWIHTGRELFGHDLLGSYASPVMAKYIAFRKLVVPVLGGTHASTPSRAAPRPKRSGRKYMSLEREEHVSAASACGPWRGESRRADRRTECTCSGRDSRSCPPA